MPPFLGGMTQYYHYGIAEYAQQETAHYKECRMWLNGVEKEIGPEWYGWMCQHALAHWQAKRPWWLV